MNNKEFAKGWRRTGGTTVASGAVSVNVTITRQFSGGGV